MQYFNHLNNEIKQYFSILEPNFPLWLKEYINTPEMERISKISMSCGTDYSKCFDVKYFYSNLDHSIGVALIIWNFTHDKTQTLAGLFHDIATPVFKHCIDFMNGDSETQESTEEKTEEIIRNSKEIMHLLKRDHINVEDVIDYHIYPIADNDTPRLSADRFEYNFSSGLTFHRIWELDQIRKVYNNIIIVKNEEGIDELAFKDVKVCEEYIHTVSKLWPEWTSAKDRCVMQFLADICKSLNVEGYLSINDLYTLSEEEVIGKIKNCKDDYLREAFYNFSNTDKCFESNTYIPDKYCINTKPKRRYINPIVKDSKNNIYGRIYDVSKEAKDDIDTYLNTKNDGYSYFDFEFTPYTKKKKLSK